MKTHTGQTISGQQLQRAREYATTVPQTCIDSIKAGTYGFASHVTQEDVQKELTRLENQIEDILAGLSDDNFTIWQRMNYHVTGEMVALLPPARKYTRTIHANQHTITHPNGTEYGYFGYRGDNAWFDIVNPGWAEKGTYPNRPWMEARCKGMMEWVV